MVREKDYKNGKVFTYSGSTLVPGRAGYISQSYSSLAKIMPCQITRPKHGSKILPGVTSLLWSILSILLAMYVAACSNVSSASSPITQTARLNTAARSSYSAALPPPVLPSDPQGQSRVITEYLKAQKLPLVGASMTADQSGWQLTLYGYVATQRGKVDAEDRTRRILTFNNKNVRVVNRIRVRPELLAMSGSEQSDSNSIVPGPPPSLSSSNQSYPQIPGIQDYQRNQDNQSNLSWLIPVLIIGLMLIP